MPPPQDSAPLLAHARYREQDLDNLLLMVLTRADTRSSHAVVALIAAGVAPGSLADELRRRTEGNPGPRLRSPEVRRPWEECGRWMRVTGRRTPSTLHLLLLALSAEDSEAGRLLRDKGLTVALTLAAAARTQELAQPGDRAFGAGDDGSRQGPVVPGVPMHRTPTLGSRRLTHVLDRLYGGPGFVHSETELDRLPTATWFALGVQLLNWAVLMLSVDAVVRDGRYWALALLPLLILSPGQVHPLPILAAAGTMAAFSPWWAAALIVLRLPFAWVDAWYDVERKRAETGRPGFSPQDLRRLSRTGLAEAVTGRDRTGDPATGGDR